MYSLLSLPDWFNSKAQVTVATELPEARPNETRFVLGTANVQISH